jgi:hypothetical protein
VTPGQRTHHTRVPDFVSRRSRRRALQPARRAVVMELAPEDRKSGHGRRFESRRLVQKGGQVDSFGSDVL